MAAHPGESSVLEGRTCHRCGYDLRGLAFQGRCPECAAPIEMSLRGDELAAADPAWVATIARGAVLVMRTAWFGILGVPTLLFAAKAGSGSSTVAFAVLLRVFAAFALLLTSILLRGMWLMTTPTEAQVAFEAPFCSRRLLRYFIVAAAISLGAEVYLYEYGPGLWFGWCLFLGAPLGVTAVAGGLVFRNFNRDLHARMVGYRDHSYQKGAWLLFFTGWLMFSMSTGAPPFARIATPGYVLLIAVPLLGLGAFQLLNVSAYRALQTAATGSEAWKAAEQRVETAGGIEGDGEARAETETAGKPDEP